MMSRLSSVIMKLALLGCVLGPPLVANAQYLRDYIFIAPTRDTSAGLTKSSYAVGGGIEQLLGNRFGAGVDFSAIIPGSGKANNTIGTTSFNGFVHPVLNSRWDPYVTAGYSLMFRDFVANGFNAGGGLNYWFRENVGLVLEVREQAGKHTPTFTENHYLEFRIGMTFR